MAPTEVETRLAALEQEVHALRAEVASLSAPKPWWEQIVGSFESDPIYQQAMALGRGYRESQASGDRERDCF